MLPCGSDKRARAEGWRFRTWTSAQSDAEEKAEREGREGGDGARQKVESERKAGAERERETRLSVRSAALKPPARARGA